MTQHALLSSLYGLPLFCVAIILIFLKISHIDHPRSKLINTYVLASAISYLLEFLVKNIFLFTDPSIEDIGAFYLYFNLSVPPSAILLFLGIIHEVIRFDKIKLKQSVIVTILLTALTLGMYIPYWFIKTHRVSGIKKWEVITLTILHIKSLTFGLSRVYQTDQIDPNLDLALKFIMSIFILYMVFKTLVKIRAENPDLDTNSLGAFLFGVFYLQSVINDTESLKSEDDLSPPIEAKGEGGDLL